ncbi:MAG: Nif3-like dinuclear metal center hexameric protein [Candidatus Thorarchaeota archaeon]
MKAELVYQSLDKEFELHKLNEGEWDFSDLEEYITESFKETRMGLVLDNSEVIEKVYTAVFPSEQVLDQILASGERNILLFTHHPLIWDTTTEGFPFRSIPVNYVRELKKKAISYYAIHVPLDRNGPYSTSMSLARALKIEIEREFFDYFGVIVGIIGRTKYTSLSDLSKHVENVVGHKLKIWKYGSAQISNQMVAAVAGGGNYPEIAEELVETEVRTYITGVTRKNPSYEPSFRFHEICQKHGINVIAATHYSTEKFACIAVRKFFDSLGLPSEFIEDGPSFNDYE